MANAPEKRTQKREKSFIITYLFNHKGYITDISEYGCQIFLEGTFPQVQKDIQTEIKIEISEYNEIGQITYALFTVKVVWIQNLEDFTIMGVNFIDMDARQTSALKKIIHYWNFLNTTFG